MGFYNGNNLRVLVVCVGNICRSPAAEYLLRDYIQQSRPDLANNIQVMSAGLAAVVGSDPHPYTQELMLHAGIDCSGHRAQQLNTEMVTGSDLVLVMENMHKRHIESQYPQSCGKVFLLGEWDEGIEIVDPYNKPQEDFVKVQKLMEHGLKQWVQKL